MGARTRCFVFDAAHLLWGHCVLATASGRKVKARRDRRAFTFLPTGPTGFHFPLHPAAPSILPLARKRTPYSVPLVRVVCARECVVQ